MDGSNSQAEFTVCQLPGKAYEKVLTTSILSSTAASLQLSRFGKSKPEDGTHLDVILKDTVLFAEGGLISSFPHETVSHPFDCTGFSGETNLIQIRSYQAGSRVTSEA